jgi:hypothetical protein
VRLGLFAFATVLVVIVARPLQQTTLAETAFKALLLGLLMLASWAAGLVRTEPFRRMSRRPFDRDFPK